MSTAEDDPDAITLIEVVNKENKNVTTTIIDLVSPPASPRKEPEPEKESIIIEDIPNCPENIPLPSLPPLPAQNVSTPPPPPPPGTPPPPPLPPSSPPKKEANIQTVVTGAPSKPDNKFSQMVASFSSPTLLVSSANQNWFGSTTSSSSNITGFQNLQDSVSYHNSGAYNNYGNETQDVVFGRPLPGTSNSNYSQSVSGASPWQTQDAYPGSYLYGSGYGTSSQISQHLESSEYSDVAHFLSTVQSLTYQEKLYLFSFHSFFFLNKKSRI